MPEIRIRRMYDLSATEEDCLVQANRLQPRGYIRGKGEAQ